jgi:hypothetical protein
MPPDMPKPREPLRVESANPPDTEWGYVRKSYVRFELAAMNGPRLLFRLACLVGMNMAGFLRSQFVSFEAAWLTAFVGRQGSTGLSRRDHYRDPAGGLNQIRPL